VHSFLPKFADQIWTVTREIWDCSLPLPGTNYEWGTHMIYVAAAMEIVFLEWKGAREGRQGYENSVKNAFLESDPPWLWKQFRDFSKLFKNNKI